MLKWSSNFSDAEQSRAEIIITGTGAYLSVFSLTQRHKPWPTFLTTARSSLFGICKKLESQNCFSNSFPPPAFFVCVCFLHSMQQLKESFFSLSFFLKRMHLISHQTKCQRQLLCGGAQQMPRGEARLKTIQSQRGLLGQSGKVKNKPVSGSELISGKAATSPA